MKETIPTEHRVCINPECKAEYDAKILSVMGITMVLGQGKCPVCAKRIYDAEIAREQAVISSTRRKWRNECGITSKFMNKDFSNFDKKRQPEAYKICADYAEKYPLAKPSGYHSLLLFSQKSWGVGKTHLACSIGHRILDRWNGEAMSCPVRFISEPEIFTQIQATYNFSPEEKRYRESESDIINSLIRARLLIIDDVGKRRVQDPKFVQRVLFAIIDGRYKRERPMVITANLTTEKLKVYLGGGIGDEASYDRLFEMIGGKAYKIEGESYRKLKAKG